MRRNQRILVVDGSTTLSALLTVRLSPLGASVEHAADGAAALAQANRQPPDLVLLEADLPDESGFEICRQFKEQPVTRDVPVIFVTAAAEPADKLRGFELGAVDYVVKPFDPDELRARVQAALKTKSLLDILTEQAEIDGLSGLHNRRFFDHRLREELRMAGRHRRWVGLVLTDIDGFKQINDRLGHPTGDAIIQAYAAVLKDNCRVSDVACRYGGDEFAVILPDADPAQTRRLAGRLTRQICANNALQSLTDQPIASSVGAAAAGPDHTLDAEQLIARADAALYRSKELGRGRVTLHDSAA